MIDYIIYEEGELIATWKLPGIKRNLLFEYSLPYQIYITHYLNIVLFSSDTLKRKGTQDEGMCRKQAEQWFSVTDTVGIEIESAFGHDRHQCKYTIHNIMSYECFNVSLSNGNMISLESELFYHFRYDRK